MTATNGTEALARRFIDEVWNQHRADTMDQLFSPDYAACDLFPGPVADRDGYKLWVRDTLHGAHNVHVTVEELIAAGDKVAMRYVLRAAPDAQARPVMGAVTLRFVEGRIREGWGVARMVDLLQRVSPRSPLH
jgi:hypothetical protein